MRVTLILSLLAAPTLAQPALAQSAEPPAAAAGDPPLSAEAFERIVEGRTFDTHEWSSGLYGVETFLPGRRAIWRDAEECKEGIWRAEGPLICFDYEGDPEPHCWTYHDRGGWLMGWYLGDRSFDPIMLYPSEDFVTCEGFLGS
jgi:hypothetical protein